MLYGNAHDLTNSTHVPRMTFQFFHTILRHNTVPALYNRVQAEVPLRNCTILCFMAGHLQTANANQCRYKYAESSAHLAVAVAVARGNLHEVLLHVTISLQVYQPWTLNHLNSSSTSFHTYNVQFPPPRPGGKSQRVLHTRSNTKKYWWIKKLTYCKLKIYKHRHFLSLYSPFSSASLSNISTAFYCIYKGRQIFLSFINN
jgi:hypothetical protein